MSKNQNKTQANKGSVTEFLSSITSQQKREDSYALLHLMEEITGEKAVMWGSAIIGFGTYHYKYESGREGDFMKVGFSPRAQNLSLYIMTGFERHDEIISRLGKFKTGKSCLYLKTLADVSEDVLRELITASYQYMTKKYG